LPWPALSANPRRITSEGRCCTIAGLIVLAGPTASGKSALALALAERLGGVVINADSMQLYRELPVLTARPGPEALARAPHRLYGVLAADRPGSVGQWLDLAAAAIAEAALAGRVAVVVGGTGLYLHALLHGLPPMPEIPEADRARVRAMCEGLPSEVLYQIVAAVEPELPPGLRPSDRQRIIRALEVRIALGRSLASLQALPPRRVPLPRGRLGLALAPPQAALAPRILARLRAMVAGGALDELRALAACGLPPDLPLMKALAVPELLAHLEGRHGLEEAIQRAAARTRQYARRQRTWLRHRLPELPLVPAFGEDLLAHATNGDLLAHLPLAAIAPDAPTLPAAA
jgi:tRNA dimethylallyltransferase